MSWQEPVSLAIGILGLVFGIYQTFSARSAKTMYRNNCRMRIRDAADKTVRLADNVIQLCRFLEFTGFAKAVSQDLSTLKAYADLSGHVGATLDVTKGWVRFCQRLNEEHEDEFNESALSKDEIKHLQDLKGCMHGLDDIGKIENNPEYLHSLKSVDTSEHQEELIEK